MSKIRPITNIALTRYELLYSAIFALPALFILLALMPSAIWIALPLTAVFFLLCRYFKKRINGYTGDSLGAMQQVIEVVFYISLLAL